jgi:DNA-binding PadR family transcriptional regulator
VSLDHILLGMLREPASGYDLKREFSAGPRHFWSAELSQIYPALSRLERQGLLKSSAEASAKGPRRRVYRRTRAGQKELLRWLHGGPVMGTQRFAYVAQLAFLHEAQDLSLTLEFMQQLRKELSGFLSFLKQTEAHHPPVAGNPGAFSDVEFHDYLCLRMGVTSIGARIAWCDECIELIRGRQRRRRRSEAAK